MVDRYSVTILGAGPAGLFAADRLAGRVENLLVIDAGPAPQARTAGVQGVGGAGLFSDGKLNLSTQIGGDPASFGQTHAEVQSIIDQIDARFSELGVPAEYSGVHTESVGLTGTVPYQSPHGRGSLEFRYQVLRVWQRSAEAFLVGGLGTIPLAPLSGVSQDALPGVIHRMEQRLTREAPPADAAKLWAATYILMGLRFPAEFTAQLLKGVRAMKESSTYQAILAEGRAEGAAALKKALLNMGGKRFGSPDAHTRAAIEAITEIDRLEQLTERVLDVSNWDELLATP